MTGVCLIPSLDRPHLVRRFFEAYKEMESFVPVWILVDRKDPQVEKYITDAPYYPKDCRLILTEEASMGNKCRAVWDQYKDMDYVILLNDDHIPRTPKWDRIVSNSINGTNVVFTNDGYVNANGPTRIAGAICFSGNILRTLGYMFIPGQQHLFSDDVWALLFSRANCALYLGNVLVQHDHAYLKKELQDDTFHKVNGPNGLNPETRQGEGGFWPEDKKVFEEWLKTKAEEDAQKVINLQPRQGVMISTPSQDGYCSLSYALGLSDVSVSLREQNVYFEMARVVGSSLLPHARNSLVDMFLKSRCQKLLFIDADQGYDRNSVWALLQSTRRIVAGITPHKRYPINLNFEPLPRDNHFFKDLTNKGVEEFAKFAQERADAQGEIEVNRSGTGMMLIDRSVFEVMKDHVGEYLPFDGNDAVTHREYFKMGIGQDKRYKGEDWHFTTLAKDLGIPIYINARAVISHTGTHTFAIQ